MTNQTYAEFGQALLKVVFIKLKSTYRQVVNEKKSTPGQMIAYNIRVRFFLDPMNSILKLATLFRKHTEYLSDTINIYIHSINS